MPNPTLAGAALAALAFAVPAFAQEPTSSTRPAAEMPADMVMPPPSGADAHQSDNQYPAPPLPTGKAVDDLLDLAATGPPPSWPAPVGDNPVYSLTLIEQLEYRAFTDASDSLAWDAQGWVGDNTNKFWWKAEGEYALEGSDEGEGDVQALYSRSISAFYDVQVGVRYDQVVPTGDATERFSLAVGLQGLAPYLFEVEPTLYLTDDGDVLGEFTGSYSQYITQRLVLQPRVDLGLAAQDVPDYGLGAGLTNVDLSLRLRYEIRREFAPYIGILYRVLPGETGNLAEQSGQDDEQFGIVAGVRIAF